MDLGLSTKRAIVTGGSRGIGKAICDGFIVEGASVSTCARGQEALDKSVQGWRDQGGTAFGRALDVTNKDEFDHWLNESAEQLGGVDVFVSNVTTRINSKGIERWQDTFEVDLLQHIRAVESVLPHLQKGKDASIVIIASIASVMAANMPSETEYGTMKAALISYGAQLAQKLGKEGIRVNLVSPGPIFHEGGFWEMVKQQQPDLYKRAEAVSVFNRLGTAKEVANTVCFLASPAASNITGVNLRVDGGAIKTVNF